MIEFLKSILNQYRQRVYKNKIKNQFDRVKKERLNEIIKSSQENLLKNDILLKINIDKCFSNRIIPTVNSNIVDRIITAYKMSKSDQQTKSIEYQVGNEWLPIYKDCMNEIMTALMGEDKVKTNSIYENFMREDCSIGLHGLPCNMESSYFGKSISKLDKDIFLYDAVYRYLFWQKLTENKFNENDLQMPLFGNAYGYFVNDVFIRTGAEYLNYYANEIQKLTQDKIGRKVIVELGGGYGGLAYFISKGIKNVTYIDFDLPENMALTAYYLLNSFPDKKILLYGEEEFSNIDLSIYDIILMPNFEISKLPTNGIDVVFNSYSLAEMSKETIDLYISELTRSCKEYFFHVNHNKISQSYIADEFGIDSKNFTLVYKKQALWNLGRNINMDEYEYLYKKGV